MSTILLSRSTRRLVHSARRGSVLITALLFSIVLAVILASYLKLATHSLRLAHRTYFADAAANLAETGLEEAVWSFNTMGNSGNTTVVTNSWSNFTRTGPLADVVMACLGSGYTSAPTVTFTGGGGSGARAVASLTTNYQYDASGNATAYTGVGAITLTSPGSGYTSVPVVVISGGGGTGALGEARLAATRTINFTSSQLDQNATGSVKVWVAGFDGSTNVPIVVAKATINPVDGAPIEKWVKVILSKNGILPKGVVAKYAITFNGHPFADSYVSSTTPGVPPFRQWTNGISRANTTIASLAGPTIDLGAQGTVDGNVMTGPGVTVTGGSVTGQRIGNFYANFNLPPYPTNLGTAGYHDLGSASSLPATLPVSGHSATPADASGKQYYYYFVSGCTIGNTTITAGKNVIIVGQNTQMGSGLMCGVSGTAVGNCTVYMDGPLTLSGNDAVNTSSWAGALVVYTSTTSDCSVSGNAQFCGCLTAPNAALRCNGSGNQQADMCGSFVVKSVTSNGHMNFHYDEGLNNLTSGKPWTLGLWTELQDASDRAKYTVNFASF